VAPEGGVARARGQAPQLGRLVPRARHEGGAVAAEGDRRDDTAMAREGVEAPAGGHVPQLDRVVSRACGEHRSVGAEGHGPDPLVAAGVPLEDGDAAERSEGRLGDDARDEGTAS